MIRYFASTFRIFVFYHCSSIVSFYLFSQLLNPHRESVASLNACLHYMDIISCLSILLQFITTVNQHLQAQRLLRCTPLRRRPRRHLCHLGFHLAPYLTGTPTVSCQSQVCHSSTPYVISLAFVALSLLQISQLGLHLCHSLRLYSLGYPGEYEDCHGFEIELEDLQCTSVYYTFSANRYGAPKKADTQTGGCLITHGSPLIML